MRPLRCLSFAPAHVCTGDEDTRARLVVVAHLVRNVEELVDLLDRPVNIELRHAAIVQEGADGNGTL
jgi:hypothetical protein